MSDGQVLQLWRIFRVIDQFTRLNFFSFAYCTSLNTLLRIQLKFWLNWKHLKSKCKIETPGWYQCLSLSSRNLVDVESPCNLSPSFTGVIFFVKIYCRFTMLLVACSLFTNFLNFERRPDSRFVCLKVLELVLRASAKHRDCTTNNVA